MTTHQQTRHTDSDQPLRYRFGVLKTTAAIALLAIVLLTLLALSTALGRSLTRTVYRQEPQSTPELRFAGFVTLPTANNAGPISVMDYMQVQGRDLFVASIWPGAVFKLPLDTNGLPAASDIGILQGEPAAHGVVLDSSGRFGFASRSGADSVDVFDVRTMQPLKRIKVVAGADGIFMDSINQRIYVAGGDGKAATLIDPATRTTIGEIRLPGEPEYAVFDSSRGLLLQNLVDQNSVAAIDMRLGAVVGVWPLTGCLGPSGIAIDAVKRRLMIVCRTNSVLLIVDADTHAVISTIKIGSTPDSVAYDDDLKRIYTIGLSGVLSVIEHRESLGYRKLQDVAIAFGAHTLAVDKITHRVYVGYLSVLTKPRIAVFDSVAPPIH